jgi:hypothetical protein
MFPVYGRKFLSRKEGSHLRGNIFADDEEVENESCKWLTTHW